MYEVESIVISCSLNDNHKVIKLKNVGLKQVKFYSPPYVNIWFMPKTNVTKIKYGQCKLRCFLQCKKFSAQHERSL